MASIYKHELCHQPIIEIKNVSVSYKHAKVIERLNVSVLQRDFVGLIGSNGAGKTTLLRTIVGLIPPDEGEIRLFGEPIGRFKNWERIGYVSQRNSLNPLFPATVKEVVLSGMYGRKKMHRSIGKHELLKAEEAMHALGIEGLSGSLIGRLSGGQQQRVMLARALINNPELLILDEPTVGIDAETQATFFHMIKHMHQHHNITFLMVSHDMEMMYSYLGSEPKHTSGKLKFYVKHSHEVEDCTETHLTHTLKDLRKHLILQQSVQ